MNPIESPAVAADAQSTLYQELIVEHKRAPRRFGKLAEPTHEARGHNPQCGDDLKVQLRIEGGRIGDIRFDGHGCAICIASASMMTEAVIGRDVDAARALQQRFRAVLTGQAEHDEAYLGKLSSLVAVRRYPSRIKCALLGWHALAHALDTRVADPGETEPHAS
ncbi:Fe-S cluster assembly sulfur transfer protein SufU [Burkholderia pseudomallei]|uniref:Fe-S cluster assembly sulfur transfer protein SufU n=1 Tax=Burkholderia pseudomallei TaxID=28450 RepID=UPI00051038F3|nr:SUF system NifU family Fe-S cluster assembly protein [Burkholderia pseudomallei]AIV62210.1 SUF system FeS assembly protein, NifU family [Burkholderia pseudomallei K42]AIV90279.1 SUF system FeS assembly protein, NifU family [Burkholderia pseudomallei B03]AIV95934.1 SUF system FeS assembly protein, NifU family [Burkholderia pseudomallei A79A]AJX79454.1 SUF system FeS assembly protein, NifU family [Burkholderia pseudomallei MSHR2543]KGC98354.1 SUF system FeS assembly protein, NifU family [Burk